MSRRARIQNEIKLAVSDKSHALTLKLVDDSDVSHFKGSFQGPPETPYEGGTFIVDIVLPDNYPFQPPKMKFDTKIYHPNISSQTGAICLDVLGSTWTPILTLRTCLVSLQLLLQLPEPSDPQDAQVASQYLNDRKGFEDTARYWTELYAKSGNDGNDSESTVSGSASNQTEDPYHGINKQVVKRFVEMGFPEDVVLGVLRQLNIRRFDSDENKRTEQESKILENLLAAEFQKT